MKKSKYLLAPALTIFSIGCATGASDLKLSDVPKNNGVFMGHIDFYNGQDKIEGSGPYDRCYVRFENEQGDTVLRVSMDESSWVFASAPVGRIYLSSVFCSVGFLDAHPELKTRELFFSTNASNPTYFGHLTIYFHFRGAMGSGMFGLLGASVEAASSSGSRDQIKIEDQFDQAKIEFEKRYGESKNSTRIREAIIEKPTPKPSPDKM